MIGTSSGKCRSDRAIASSLPHTSLGCLLVGFAILISSAQGDPVGDRGSSPNLVATHQPGMQDWLADLQDDDIVRRRKAAQAMAAADAAILPQAMSILPSRLAQEKDPQVRLDLVAVLTRLGPAAEPAADAVVNCIRTDYSLSRNEDTHLDFRCCLALAAMGPAATNRLCSLLNSPESHLREQASSAIGRIGPEAEIAIPDLIGMCADTDAEVRRAASVALGRMGPPAVERLLDACQNDQPATRAAALDALGYGGMRDKRIVAMAEAKLADNDPVVRAAAVTTLSAVSTTNEALRSVFIDSLKSEDEIVRAAAVRALLSNHRSLLVSMNANLIPLLSHPNSRVAWNAAFLLQSEGLKQIPILLAACHDEQAHLPEIAAGLALLGSSSTPSLLSALRDPSPRVRGAAALALGQVRPVQVSTVDALGKALGDTDTAVDMALLVAFQQLGRHADTAVNSVRKELQHPAAIVRQQAIETLTHIAPHRNELVDDLVLMLHDSDAAVRYHAVESLRAVGPAADRALPDVIALITTSPIETQLAALDLIRNDGQLTESTVAILCQLLASDNPTLQASAARTLAIGGKDALPALDKLRPLLISADRDVRVAAVQAIVGLGLDAAVLRPLLVPRLRDSEIDVRRATSKGIQRLGKEGVLFLPDLIALADSDEMLRVVKRSIRPFEAVGPDPASIPELIPLLHHESNSVQLLTIQFLGLAGAAAQCAIPDLEQLLSHPLEEVRTQSKKAIDMIRR